MKKTVLGIFISNCIHWINTAEEVRESGVKYVSLLFYVRLQSHSFRLLSQLCMFLVTLFDADILDKDDAVVVEITHFCLDYSRYSDAIQLYTRLT